MAENNIDPIQTSNQPEPVTPASDVQNAPQSPVDTLHYASDQASTAQGEPQPTPAATPDTQVSPEWDGKLETLPEALQPRYKEMLRHMHQVSQEAASVKQKAQEYEALANDPSLKEFLAWKEQRQGTPQTEAPAAPNFGEITEEELLAAQNDPRVYASLVQRQIQSQVMPVAQQMLSRMEAMEHKMRRDQSEREIESFAQVHPDFYEIDPIVLKASLDEVVVKGKGTLLDAYNKAKDVEKQYLEKARNNINQSVQQKKAGVTAAPSRGVSPEVIYAPNSREANYLAAKYAAEGKQVDVRVKK